MTESNDYDADSPYNPPVKTSGGLRWMSLLVITLIVFGFISLVWYAYNASTKHAGGSPKVVQAPNQSYKHKPKESGGLAIEHKDIDAYKLMRRGAGEAPEERVERLRPREDEPVTIYRQQSEDPVKNEEMSVIDRAERNMAAPPKKMADTMTAKPDVAEQADTEKGELPAGQRKAPEPPDLAQPQPTPDIEAQAPKRENSQPTPANASEASPASASVPSPVAKPATPRPTSEPTRDSGASDAYVQLAALRSRAEAERDWERINATHPVLLKGYRRVIKQVNISGKGTFYRLRIKGFAGKQEASQLCQTLKRRGQDCLSSR